MHAKASFHSPPSLESVRQERSILCAEPTEFNLRSVCQLVDARSAHRVSQLQCQRTAKYARTKCSDGGCDLKLALIGTHGVGKTTLAYEVCSLLKKAHHNVELVTEVARHSPFPVNAATTIEGQLWILHAQIAAELDAGRRAPQVIADRSVLDNYCYLVKKFGRQPQLEPWLAWWMNTYDLLVGVPPGRGGVPAGGFCSHNP